MLDIGPIQPCTIKGFNIVIRHTNEGISSQVRGVAWPLARARVKLSIVSSMAASHVGSCDSCERRRDRAREVGALDAAARQVHYPQDATECQAQLRL